MVGYSRVCVAHRSLRIWSGYANGVAQWVLTARVVVSRLGVSEGPLSMGEKVMSQQSASTVLQLSHACLRGHNRAAVRPEDGEAEVRWAKISSLAQM